MQSKVPNILYGTAWKKERTAELTYEALKSGFQGIDCANQPKHYNEAGAGKGFQDFVKETGKPREAYFIQTKFTPPHGQGERLPYDSNAPISEQVRKSFENSLEHWGTQYIDSLLLHAPYHPRGLTNQDWEVWRTFEALHREKKVHCLGVSNVTAAHLAALYDEAEVKPSFVQNRCFATKKWDREVRELCQTKGIQYQGFSLLTANLSYIESEPVREIARRFGKTIPQIVLRFSQQLNMLPLTGTTDTQHMHDDLTLDEFSLSEDDIRTIESIA